MFINRRYSLINIDWTWVILTPGSGVYKRFDVIATTDSALFPPMLRISTNKSTTWWFLKSFPALLHSAYWNIDSFSFVKTLHVVKRPDFYFSLQNFMNSLYGVTRGGTPGNSSWGRPVLQILTLFQTKKCPFPHPFSDLASCLHRQKLCHHYLDIKTKLALGFLNPS